MRKRIYLLPNLFTTGNIFCGVMAMYLAINGRGLTAAWMIFAAMCFDSLDGAVARLQNTSSDFGIQYDSLSDLLSFGVAPMIIVLEEGLKGTGRLGLVVSFIYVVCVALRLARFNVESAVAASAASASGSSSGKSDFVGLPSPAGAGFVAGFIIASYSLNFIPVIIRILPILMLGIAWLMVSNIRYPAFSKKIFSTRSPFFYFVSTVILFTLFLFQIEYFMLVLFSVYILFGIANRLKIASRFKVPKWISVVFENSRRFIHFHQSEK